MVESYKPRVYPMRPAPLLVGRDNPLSADPRLALWPAPKNSAGWHLCYDILRMEKCDYLRQFDRTNLAPGEWPGMREARYLARKLLETQRRRVMVLFGRDVQEAFGVARRKFFSIVEKRVLIPHQRHKVEFTTALVLLPHPSGLCREWNDWRAGFAAREILHGFGVVGIGKHGQVAPLEEVADGSG